MTLLRCILEQRPDLNWKNVALNSYQEWCYLTDETHAGTMLSNLDLFRRCIKTGVNIRLKNHLTNEAMERRRTH